MSRKLQAQIMKFVFVGGTATLLDMGILFVLNQYLGVYHLIAATIAFVIATFYNYYLSMKFVFKSKFGKEARHKEFIAFFVLSLCGLGITILGMFIMVDLSHLPVMLAKILVGVIVMTFNFVSRKIYFEQA